MADLICPKCQSPMRSYERNGVTIDQCTGCRGVFLDRGELERLVDAESSYYERSSPPPPSPSPGPPPPRRRERNDDDDRHFPSHGYGAGHGHHGKRRKKSFLDDIFDFG
jgi:uncharacterized protein